MEKDLSKIRITPHPPIDIMVEEEAVSVTQGLKSSTASDQGDGNTQIRDTKGFQFALWKVDDTSDVDPGSGYCNSNGHWGVEAYIDHQSFWCKSYKLGIEFGYTVGNQFIALTPTYWGPEQKHCNGDRLYHQGAGQDLGALAANYHQITSARRRLDRS